MVARPKHAVAFALIVGTLLSACAPASPLVNETDEVVVNMLVQAGERADTTQYTTALLATSATPVRVRFRSAEEFVLERASDGAKFAWNAVTPPGAPDGGPLYTPLGGNYALSESGGPTALGRKAFSAGDVLRLRIVSGGRAVSGSVVVPSAPELRLTVSGDERRVSWRPVHGAMFYLVSGAPSGPRGSTKDTTVTVIRGNLGREGGLQRVSVSAVDSNYGRYLSDTSVTSSGIIGAYGVLGAINVRTILVPFPRR